MNTLLMKGFASTAYAHVIAKEIATSLQYHASALGDPDMIERTCSASANLIAAAAHFALEMDACREIFERMVGPVSIPVALPLRTDNASSGEAHI